MIMDDKKVKTNISKKYFKEKFVDGDDDSRIQL